MYNRLCDFSLGNHEYNHRMIILGNYLRSKSVASVQGKKKYAAGHLDQLLRKAVGPQQEATGQGCWKVSRPTGVNHVNISSSYFIKFFVNISTFI